MLHRKQVLTSTYKFKEIYSTLNKSLRRGWMNVYKCKHIAYLSTELKIYLRKTSLFKIKISFFKSDETAYQATN